MNLRTLFVTAVLVFVVSGVARAAELSTAAMYTTGSTHFKCSITNVSAVTQTVRIRVYDLNGTVTADSEDFFLAARGTVSFGSLGSGHCRFTTGGAKTLVRASILVYDGTKTVAALPAQ